MESYQDNINHALYSDRDVASALMSFSAAEGSADSVIDSGDVCVAVASRPGDTEQCRLFSNGDCHSSDQDAAVGAARNIAGHALEPASSNRCLVIACPASARIGHKFCSLHMGNRMCQHGGCEKYAQGRTVFCLSHGGGNRCLFIDCTRAARDTAFCVAHGGGKVR